MKEIDERTYKRTSLDELVTYAVYCLGENGEEATFENVVAMCYRLFPKKFALVGYPQWPDSARVNKSWLRCRTDFKYISGSVKSGFKLTSKGFEIVERIQRRIKSPIHRRKELKKQAAGARTREETFINQIEHSDVFRRYREKDVKFEMSEYELCDLLFCTLETPTTARQKNINLLIDYAERLNRLNVIEFLKFCKSKYTTYLAETSLQDQKTSYRGGMQKKKIRRRETK